MITDLDETLKQLLIKKAGLEPTEVEITFEVPNREWSASISKPTINLYLYDIRENHNLRGTEWFTEKNGSNITRRKKANRINLSYLITVWTNNIEDQHRLLWRVLLALSRYPTIPDELLSGDLAKQGYPVVTSTAQPDGLFSNPSDFWAALDNEIRPAINCVITVPMDLDISFTSPEVKTATYGVKPVDAESENFMVIRGIVHAEGSQEKRVAGLTIIAKEAGMSSVTDSQGEYIFHSISQGKHTFQVLLDGEKIKEVKMTVPGRQYDIEV